MSNQDFTTFREPGTTAKITSLFDFSAEALGQLKFWLEQAGLNIPISQIIGFSGFTFQPAPTIVTSEATASTSFTDLATVGPTITGLPKGKYAIFFGAQMQPASGDNAIMSVQVNSTTATDADSITLNGAAVQSSLSRLILQDLTAENNTLTAKYRCTAGLSNAFLRRWLIAIKYDNI